MSLLDTLTATDCRFACHSDFDWPGVALANRIIRRYDARPWRLTAEDYKRLAARSQSESVPRLPLDRPRWYGAVFGTSDPVPCRRFRTTLQSNRRANSAPASTSSRWTGRLSTSRTRMRAEVGTR
nr:DUF2399 domain-containing protein [Streptomyces olivoreticuli]